jgi:hypothetical protein
LDGLRGRRLLMFFNDADIFDVKGVGKDDVIKKVGWLIGDLFGFG